jgi:pimeloyl-ACP methyl ester carboxylesterase
MTGSPTRHRRIEDRRRPLSETGPREWLLSRMPMTEQRLDLAGISTAVLEGGNGDPLILLHGPGEYAAKWLRAIPHLVTTHRVIAPDLPGHGASEALDRLPVLESMLEWLNALIDRTCSAPPTLVGQILGGAIATRFASRHSDRLSGLVLVDTFGLAPFQPAPEFGHALTEFIAEPTEETHDRLWQRCAFDLDLLRDQLGESWDRIRSYNLDRARVPKLRATQQCLMGEFGLPPIPASDLARIAPPTTLIWGRHDLATPLAVAEVASARYGWPLHVIEDAADDPPIEQPDAFVKVLRAAVSSS